MRSLTYFACFVIGSAILLGGCGGEDGEPSGGGATDSAAPPADGAGTWYGTYLNDGAATLTDCTGNLIELNGMTVAELLELNTCSGDEGILVTQEGHVITFQRQEYTCLDGNYGYSFGSGRVNGSAVEFEIRTVSSYYGFTETDHFHGTVTGPSSVTAYMDRISATGSLHGSCQVSPELRCAIEIEGRQGIRLSDQGVERGAILP